MLVIIAQSQSEPATQCLSPLLKAGLNQDTKKKDIEFCKIDFGRYRWL